MSLENNLCTIVSSDTISSVSIATDNNVPEEPVRKKRSVGRPCKYATDEERKEAAKIQQRAAQKKYDAKKYLLYKENMKKLEELQKIVNGK